MIVTQNYVDMGYGRLEFENMTLSGLTRKKQVSPHFQSIYNISSPSCSSVPRSQAVDPEDRKARKTPLLVRTLPR